MCLMLTKIRMKMNSMKADLVCNSSKAFHFSILFRNWLGQVSVVKHMVVSTCKVIRLNTLSPNHQQHSPCQVHHGLHA